MQYDVQIKFITKSSWKEHCHLVPSSAHPSPSQQAKTVTSRVTVECRAADHHDFWIWGCPKKIESKLPHYRSQEIGWKSLGVRNIMLIPGLAPCGVPSMREMMIKLEKSEVGISNAVNANTRSPRWHTQANSGICLAVSVASHGYGQCRVHYLHISFFWWL